ncbi:hypothetical protein C8R43DRAFT_1124249 [Mycena crocata]|nr:hypothetical protein C8R43DRAFT_1124249 [Mycena crocata]
MSLDPTEKIDPDETAARLLAVQRVLDLIAEAEAERQRTGGEEWVWVKYRATNALESYGPQRLRKFCRAKQRRAGCLLYEERLPMYDQQRHLYPCLWDHLDNQKYVDAHSKWGDDSADWGQEINPELLDPGYGLRPEHNNPSPILIPHPLPITWQQNITTNYSASGLVSSCGGRKTRGRLGAERGDGELIDILAKASTVSRCSLPELDEHGEMSWVWVWVTSTWTAIVMSRKRVAEAAVLGALRIAGVDGPGVDGPGVDGVDRVRKITGCYIHAH